MMKQLSDQIAGTLRWLRVWPEAQPIADVPSLIEFVRTRAAYIGQTSLYGYLKTRMGTRYRDYFDDEQFAASMRMAAVKVSISCLEDLSIYAVASAADPGGLTRDQTIQLASCCFAAALDEMVLGEDRAHIPADSVAAFEARIHLIDWQRAGLGETAFSRSPEALVRYAPVADEFKVQDRQIVMNSIRFAWRDIRERLTKRLHAKEVCNDWRASGRHHLTDTIPRTTA